MCEYPEFANTSHPVARKDHVCCECHETIPKGTRYHRIEGKWNDAFETYKWCQRCDEVRDVIDTSPWECVPYGDLWNCWREEVAAEEELAFDLVPREKLPPAQLKKLLELIENQKTREEFQRKTPGGV